MPSSRGIKSEARKVLAGTDYAEATSDARRGYALLFVLNELIERFPDHTTNQRLCALGEAAQQAREEA